MTEKLESIVISHCMDADFGKLELVETRTKAAASGGPWEPVVYRSWAGDLPGIGAKISIDMEDDPSAVSEEIRIWFRRIMADLDAFKRMVAASELKLAREWAGSGDSDISLDEDSFSKSLKVKEFSIDPKRLTVWLEEDACIFAGHSIEVRIENGKIAEICLAG